MRCREGSDKYVHRKEGQKIEDFPSLLQRDNNLYVGSLNCAVTLCVVLYCVGGVVVYCMERL